MCNTYRFSTATLVTRTRLKCDVVRTCLSFSATNFRKIFRFRSICSNLRSRSAQKKAYVLISCPLMLPDFNQKWNMLAKLAIQNLMQVPSVVLQLQHTGSQEDKAERGVHCSRSKIEGKEINIDFLPQFFCRLWTKNGRRCAQQEERHIPRYTLLFILLLP